jgi:hypothetical protein
VTFQQKYGPLENEQLWNDIMYSQFNRNRSRYYWNVSAIFVWFRVLAFYFTNKDPFIKKLVTCQKSSWLSSWRRGTAFFVIVQGACAKFPTWTTRYEITQFPDSERVLNCENVSKTCATTWWVTYARKKSINSSGDRIDGSVKRES